MLFFDTIHVLLVVLIVEGICDSVEFNETIKGEELCKSLNVEPYFEPDLVVGKTWRIVYSWNVKLDSKCVDMTFKTPTSKIVTRIANDMYDYLETQPYWDAAILLVVMGAAHHEMLIFSDQGAAGRVVGVPNVIKDGALPPQKHSIPLFKMSLKLFENSRYLVTTDCVVGVTTLAVRRDQMASPEEIKEFVPKLGLGMGSPACTIDQ